MTDVVVTPMEAAALEREPLIVLEPLAAFLNGKDVGRGALQAQPIGDGHSNVTYLLERDRGERFVLRRPPRGPLASSTHDVLREARLLVALQGSGVRVPEIVVVCDDESVIGAPFYVMGFVDGYVVSERMPPAFYSIGDPVAMATQLVDALVALHALDLERLGLTELGRPDGYLDRQVRRFRSLLVSTETRPLPQLHEVADWLEANRPTSGPATIVHGDYRLGNVLFAARPGPWLAAVLDWEMATLGDPLADVGYLTAMWAQRGDPHDPMLDLSAATRGIGFPGRDALAKRYAERSGRSVDELGWYQVLAIWKAAIFLEGSYSRYLAGSTDDRYFAGLGDGVPALARRARALAKVTA